MKIRFLLLFIVSMSIYTSNAQEYWDPEDFEISRREVKSALLEVGFSWVEEKKFYLPSGEFLNKDPYEKKNVDLRAVLAKTKDQRPHTVDIDLRIPQKEKKAIEITGQRENDNVNFQQDAFYSNPLYRNYGRSNYLRYGNPSNPHYNNFRRIYF
ncbi:hypothetical protein [Autumnicola edwardsiae]|uniref:Uncharacterized protein n=1 Tax=Autumnicola edwardsiae TaxID=3075594 RepID=A0ABU3CT87_9FLAO|nr:hypothetical protein [Zunongwangia sp. F297]MDT0649574.1 hypothetical protein [Zunongwangia sp. F297]